MFKNYPKIPRIPWDKQLFGKRYLTPTQVMELLDGEVTVEEKIDGKNTYGHVNFRGKEYELFAEWCKWKHSIPYNKLPSWHIIFDIWDYDNQRFLNYDEKYDLCNGLGVSKMLAPKITIAKFDRIADLIPLIQQSKYSTDQIAEGIVVKNYTKQLFGKLVRKEFITGIEEHWMLKEPEMNQLA